MRTWVLLLFCFVCCGRMMVAQDYVRRFQQEAKDLPFQLYADKVNHYFDSLKLPRKGLYKIWKRQEWWAKMHLGEDGRVANYISKNLEAAEQIRRRAGFNNKRSNSGQWLNIGYSAVDNGGNVPRLGRANCIVFSPVNGNIMYVGTAGGGIWKSQDGGNSWFCTTEGLPTMSISSLAITSNGNTLYAVTGDGFNANIYVHDGIGILKSTDAGVTWKNIMVYEQVLGYGGYKIQINPNNENEIWAALNFGLFRSLDGGVTWNNLTSGQDVTDFEFKPDDPSVIYYTVGYSPVIYKLNVNTLSTTQTTLTTLKPVTRIELEVCESSPESVYALVGPGFNPFLAGVPNDSSRYNGLYFSGDAGSNFNLRNNNINVFGGANEQSFYDIVLKVNPVNVNEVVFGGVALYKSIDGGINSQQLNSNNPIHSDCHGLALNEVNGNLYVCTDGGVSYSSDFGSSWSGFIGGIINNEVYRLSISQTSDLLICGVQDNGQFIRNGPTFVYHGMVLNLDGMDNIIDHSNNNIIYACTQNGSMVKSTNGGNSFTWLTTPMGAGPWITPIIQSPSVPNTIFYGGLLGIYRSADGGSTWSNIGGANGASVLATNNDGSGDILYGISGNSVFRCDNPLASTPLWTSLSNPLSAPPSALVINPANNSEVWISCAGYQPNNKLARSINKGSSWVDLTLGLPSIPIYSLAFANNNNNPGGALYIGTELGVFYGDDSTPDWNPFYNYIPMVPVTDMAVNYSTGEVTAATFGRGIWKSEQYTECESILNLFNVVYGKRFYQASDVINSTQSLTGSTGNELRLRAGNKLVLGQGFSVREGAYFLGKIGSCGIGAP